MNYITFALRGTKMTLNLEHIVKTEFYPAHTFKVEGGEAAQVPAELHIYLAAVAGGGCSDDISFSMDKEKLSGELAEKVHAFIVANGTDIDGWYAIWKENL